jgi:hypothetical protein
MKNLIRSAILGLLALPGGVALAATFQLFSPATGVLKGNVNTYVTTAATSADVISLWSGTCNSTTFLRADGSCNVAGSGTVTSVAAGNGLSASPSPITGAGTLSVDQAFAFTWTGIHTFDGTYTHFTQDNLFYTGLAGDWRFHQDASNWSVDQCDGFNNDCVAKLSFSATGNHTTLGSGGNTTISSGSGSLAFSGGHAAFDTPGNLLVNATNMGLLASTTLGLSAGADLEVTVTGNVVMVASGGSVSANGSELCRQNGTGCPAGATPGGSDTQLQFNNAGAFGGDDDLSWTAASRRLNLGTSAGNPVTIRGQNATGSADGTALTISAGSGGTTLGDGGGLDLSAGIPATSGVGGSVTVSARNGVGTNKNGGNVTIVSGAATGSGIAGTVTVNGQNVRDAALFTSGTLPVARGGTGVTTSTGTGSVVLSASPTLTGTVTAATVAATTVTVGGNNVCQSTGTNCPAAASDVPSYSRFTTTGSSCTAWLGAKANISSCARTSAGLYNVTLTSGGGGNTPSCVVSNADNTQTGIASATSTSSTNVQVQMRNGSGTATDIDFFLDCHNTP